MSPDTPVELRAWYRDGLKLYKAGLPLERALGLKTDKQELRIRRNNLLAELFENFTDCEKSSWRRCDELRIKILRFESLVWSGIKNEKAPHDKLPEEQFLLFQMMKTSLPTLTTCNQIHNLLKEQLK